MTLPASGAISLFAVNDELGLSHTAQIGLLCTNVRTLFGTASGAVGLTTGYGKSNTTVPGVPTGVSASVTSCCAISVSFSAPACTGHLTIDSYQVVCTSSGSNSATGSSSPISFTGLSASTSYTFKVRAHNSKGYGSYSSASNSASLTLAFNGFNTPADISTAYMEMTSVAVNSSGLFVAVGYQSSSYPAYTTSSDGSTWTTPNYMSPNNSCAGIFMGTIQSVTVNSSGLFVAVGYKYGYGANCHYPLYATSTDGINWPLPATMNGSTTPANMRSVTVNSSGLFVAVGYNNSNYPVYATSSNGSTWTTPALMNGSTAGANMDSVAVNSSGLFVAVGNIAYPYYPYPVYATSSDGSTWTTPATMNGSTTTAYMTGVTVNSSGLFVAVGYDNNSNYPLYATSSDGSTWTTPAAMNGSGSFAQMKSVAVNRAGVFVAVGNDGNNYPVYATSSNGSTWTTPAQMNGSAVSSRMNSVTANKSGLFVSVGINVSVGHPWVAKSN